MKIYNDFIDKKGNFYSGVRNVAFKSSNIFGNIGTLVNETKREENDFFRLDPMEIDDRGVYIFRSFYDDRIALRIYKCFADYGFNGEGDEQLIYELQQRQNNVKLVEFPIGVVTKDGYVIGQEIPYYSDYYPLIDIVNKVNKEELLYIYKKCLLIIKELLDKGISYYDIHPRNFLVNKELDVKLIDFEPNLVRFDLKEVSGIIINNLRNMNYIINERIGYKDWLDVNSKSIDDTINNVEEIKKKLILR